MLYRVYSRVFITVSLSLRIHKTKNRYVHVPAIISGNESEGILLLWFLLLVTSTSN